MKHKLELTVNEKAMIYAFVDTGRFGDSLQDKYLMEFSDMLSDIYSKYGMNMPAVVCDEKAYSFSGNHRILIDMVNHRKDVFVYFNHPSSSNYIIPSSDLYIGTFSKEMKAPILIALENMKADYRTTPIGITPITAIVDMKSFQTGNFHRKYAVQSLDYDPKSPEGIIKPEHLFDVKDSEQSKYDTFF